MVLHIDIGDVGKGDMALVTELTRNVVWFLGIWPFVSLHAERRPFFFVCEEADVAL